jgi:hypothetical protein
MQRVSGLLLLIDAFINPALGAMLLFIPHVSIELFGLPQTNTYFYASILGAVLLGIGIALLIERFCAPRLRGLGPAGAISINFVAAGAVAIWLLADPFEMPFRGYLVLWIVVALVIGTGIAELIIESRQRSGSG